jgi:hypothetical protein
MNTDSPAPMYLAAASLPRNFSHTHKLPLVLRLSLHPLSAVSVFDIDGVEVCSVGIVGE